MVAPYVWREEGASIAPIRGLLYTLSLRGTLESRSRCRGPAGPSSVARSSGRPGRGRGGAPGSALARPKRVAHVLRTHPRALFKRRRFHFSYSKLWYYNRILPVEILDKRRQRHRVSAAEQTCSRPCGFRCEGYPAGTHDTLLLLLLHRLLLLLLSPVLELFALHFARWAQHRIAVASRPRNVYWPRGCLRRHTRPPTPSVDADH